MSIKVNREAILNNVKQLPPNIVVIECAWDGDSSGWFVDVIAVEQSDDNQYRYHFVGLIGHGMGEIHDFNRSLTGETPPYPEGLLAQEIGQEIADMLGVPFYFPSPEEPALEEIPRWIDWKEGRLSSIPIHVIDYEAVVRQFGSRNVAVVEAFWDYFHTWHPRLAIVTVEDTNDDPPQYEAHNIGKLYWDEHDMGQIVHGTKIPSHTPVEEALRLGNLLAEALNTTFYFAAPDNPRWHIPRWIDIQDDRDGA